MHRRLVLVSTVIAVLTLVASYSGEGRLTGAGSGHGSGCSLVQGPPEGRVVPVIATCDWSVSAARIHQLIGDFGRHDVYFSNLSESSVITNEDGVARVRQVHRAMGIVDREVVVEWRIERFPDGARYSWRKVPGQSLVDANRVEVEETSGFWDVRGDDNRTKVVYEMRYLPGGGFPLFVLRLFQSSGIESVLADLRDAVDLTVVASQTGGDASHRAVAGGGESDAGMF